LLVFTILLACGQTSQPTQTPVAASHAAAASTEKVYVVFEGPWAFVADPKDATKVLALAPKSKAHRDFHVVASNRTSLGRGFYDLSFPVSGPGAGTFDPDIVRAIIAPADVQHALDTKAIRYAIRLPKPEAYGAARRYRSKVGPSSDKLVEKEWA